MARKAKRDLTVSEQLARGPMDLPLLMLTMLLLGVCLIMVLSASYATAYYDPETNTPLDYAIKQGGFALFGLLVMFVISKTNYQTLRVLSPVLLIGSMVLLALVLTPLGVRLNGAKRWLRMLLVAGPTFQPSEIVKVTIILYFAHKLCRRDRNKLPKRNLRTRWGRIQSFSDHIGFTELLFPYGVVLMIVALLLMLEPHLSGTILVIFGALSVMFAAGIHWGWFVAGILGGGSLFFLIAKLTPYMNDRLTLYLDPWSDPLGKGYQTIQSLYAIGSGGLLGLGLGKSRQKFLFLPEPENDFIFSVAVEELGFVGGILILGLFMLFILRSYWIALHARDRFGALTAVGITTLFAVQVFLNIAVVTKLIPNTGISLPFFSYGGTALVIQLAEVGILLSISRQIPAPKQD